MGSNVGSVEAVDTLTGSIRTLIIETMIIFSAGYQNSNKPHYGSKEEGHDNIKLF